MNTDLHKFDKHLFDKLKEVGYQSCQLRGNDDEIIITYNTPGTTIDKKLLEIKKRFTVLEPGIYKLFCMQKHGGRGKADCFLIKHGEFNTQEYITNTKPAAALNEEPHVLSYKEALARIEELAAIKAERDALKLENENLKLEITELEAELDELEDAPALDEQAGLAKGFNDLAVTALPVLDRYFDTKNRQLQIEEHKLAMQYQKMNKARPAARRPAPAAAEQTDYPDLTDQAAVDAFLDEMDILTDEQLAAALSIIQTENPALFDICINEFFPEGEEEEEEEPAAE